jgi:3-phosphoshikimate 1-carboxyvinyltransferase
MLSSTENFYCEEELRYDFVNEPDLVQTLAVTCCIKNVSFEFSGLQSLKIKETDRIAALIAELKKLGYVLRELPENTLKWNGERCQAQEKPCIKTYDDHRMAMAFAPVALTQTIEIEHPEVVSKSYPRFWEDLEKI